MHSTTRNRWIVLMLLVAVTYAVVGIVTSNFASSPSPQTLRAWRGAAWLVSLIAFTGQIAYEQLRFRSAVKSTAAHAAAAVALGAFVLAAAGPVRSHWGASEFLRVTLLSLAAWPLLLGLPAYLAALAIGTLLRRLGVRETSAN
jgi:hypothetical protein